MQQVKMFSGKEQDKLQKEINTFVERYVDNIIDLKINVCEFVIFATLIYEGRLNYKR